MDVQAGDPDLAAKYAKEGGPNRWGQPLWRDTVDNGNAVVEYQGPGPSLAWCRYLQSLDVPPTPAAPPATCAYCFKAKPLLGRWCGPCAIAYNERACAAGDQTPEQTAAAVAYFNSLMQKEKRKMPAPKKFTPDEWMVFTQKLFGKVADEFSTRENVVIQKFIQAGVAACAPPVPVAESPTDALQFTDPPEANEGDEE